MIRIEVSVIRTVALGCLLFFAGACDFLGPDGPKGPGDLFATMVSPNGNEGSAVFELSGGVGLGTVSPVGGEVFYEHSGSSTRIAVIMDEPGEVRFQIRTENVGHLPEVTVIQVADGENDLRTSLSGYKVEFTWEEDSSKKGLGG